MRKDLLLQAAAMLEADAANPTGVRFDLGNWAVPYINGKTYCDMSVAERTGPVNINCGTAACAMGLFALSGKFPGLRMALLDDAWSGPIWAPKYGDDDGDGSTKQRSEGYYAAVAMFDINYEQASELFSPNAYLKTEGAVAELAVAKRIRDLVARTPD